MSRRLISGRMPVVLVMVLLGFLIVMIPEALAQPEAEVNAKADQSMIMWLIGAQGLFFVPQLMISLILVALITTNILAIRRQNFIPVEFPESFERFVKDKKFNEALELAKNDASMLGKLVSSGVQSLSGGYQEAIEAMEEVGEEENLRYEQRLSYLALIGNIATLIGLLGTVWGMVGAFREISISGTTPDTAALADSVSQALVTTVAGLIQAIPAIICFTIFKNRVAMLVLEVANTSDKMMQRFKGITVRKS